MELSPEDADTIYHNLDTNNDGVLSTDEILKNFSENEKTKIFLEKLNENLLPTTEVIRNKLNKLREKIGDDKESNDDIDW